MSIIDRIGRGTARLRRVLAPRPWIRWLVLVALAIGFVAAVADHRRGVGEAREAWGDTTEVWVAARTIEPGTPIVASRVRLPVAALPAQPVDDDPSGTTARQAIGRGEVVTSLDVAADGAPGDLIPSGWLAVPIAEATVSLARIGERVVVTTDGVVIADEALVVDDLDGVPLVAVPAEAAPLVALANDTGVTLLRMP
ncbi:MAG: hypothetical protein CL424_04835 [Acidimicrobiaceae bacterium]|nr:hypothetical protein [Acidimicrobiaceae bacterium]